LRKSGIDDQTGDDVGGVVIRRARVLALVAAVPLLLGATCSGGPSLTTPTAPTNFLGSVAPSQMSLSWSAPTSNGGLPVTGYQIWRSVNSSWTETLYATVGVTTSYLDSGLTNGSTYYYRIGAVNALGLGLLSGEVKGTPALPKSAPSSPVVSASTRNAAVTLNWQTPANGNSPILGYDVYRSTATGKETYLTQVGVVNTYTDAAVTHGTVYYYEMDAFNAIGFSSPSREVSIAP
jgi:fibronectin type 3 domain-containing protein